MQQQTRNERDSVVGGEEAGPRRCGEEPGVVGCRAVRGVAVAAAGAAALGWVAARLAGVDLEVGAGAGQRVALPSVVVASVVATYAGAGLLRLLQRRTRHAERTWTAISLLVLVASSVGPLGARTPQAATVLLALHVVVAAVVVTGLLRRTRALAP